MANELRPIDIGATGFISIFRKTGLPKQWFEFLEVDEIGHVINRVTIHLDDRISELNEKFIKLWEEHGLNYGVMDIKYVSFDFPEGEKNYLRDIKLSEKQNLKTVDIDDLKNKLSEEPTVETVDIADLKNKLDEDLEDNPSIPLMIRNRLKDRKVKSKAIVELYFSIFREVSAKMDGNFLFIQMTPEKQIECIRDIATTNFINSFKFL